MKALQDDLSEVEAQLRGDERNQTVWLMVKMILGRLRDGQYPAK
jgi:hypothetical protein